MRLLVLLLLIGCGNRTTFEVGDCLKLSNKASWEATIYQVIQVEDRFYKTSILKGKKGIYTYKKGDMYTIDDAYHYEKISCNIRSNCD